MTHSVFDRLWLRNEIPEKISRAFDPDILILVDWHTLWRIQPPHPPPLSPPLYRRLFILIYPYTMHTLWLVRVRLGDRVTSLTTLSLVSFILVHWLVKIFPTHTLVGPFLSVWSLWCVVSSSLANHHRSCWRHNNRLTDIFTYCLQHIIV